METTSQNWKTIQNYSSNELFLALDIAKGPGTSYGGNKFWIIIQDMSIDSDMLWSRFVKHKSDLVDRINTFFTFLKIRQDHQGCKNKIKNGQCR